jgi:hypothetical protein
VIVDIKITHPLEDTMKNTSPVRVAGLALTAALATGWMVPAHASHGGDGLVKSGSCSKSANWKLKASAEDGRIEVEGEVDSNVNGQTWNWRILHNTKLSARGTATTVAPSGSFEVRRLLVNVAGPDRIGWRATNPRSGETCSGGLTF